MQIWLAQDPESKRITAQDREFVRQDFPRGKRGRDWERRTVDVPAGTYTKIVRANYSPDAQDVVHQRWWSQGTTVDSDLRNIRQSPLPGRY